MNRFVRPLDKALFESSKDQTGFFFGLATTACLERLYSDEDPIPVDFRHRGPRKAESDVCLSWRRKLTPPLDRIFSRYLDRIAACVSTRVWLSHNLCCECKFSIPFFIIIMFRTAVSKGLRHAATGRMATASIVSSVKKGIQANRI